MGGCRSLAVGATASGPAPWRLRCQTPLAPSEAGRSRQEVSSEGRRGGRAAGTKSDRGFGQGLRSQFFAEGRAGGWRSVRLHSTTSCEVKEVPSEAATPRRVCVTPRILVGALPRAALEWCEHLRPAISPPCGWCESLRTNTPDSTRTRARMGASATTGGANRGGACLSG